MKKLLKCIIFVLLPVISNSQHTIEHPSEPHSCSTLKSSSPLSGGTYQQNPLLWDYDVSFYGLDVFVDPTINEISGSVRVQSTVVATSLEEFVLELLDNMTVDSVIMQQQALNFIHSDNELVISLPQAFLRDELLDLTVYYKGQPESEGFFSGFRIDLTPFEKPVLWTLSEPLNARQWWPVKQVLEDKADSLTVIITTPSPNKAASNGLLISTDTLDNDLLRYHWHSNYPIAYYLISLAVSEYFEYNFYAPLSNPADQVFVQNFIYDDPEYFDQQKANIDLTSELIEAFSVLFLDYPFADEKYGHATAPLGGGMEHQTISTMSGFSRDLVSHELGHQWFGDNVTCATWSDIWINEGFASYSEYLAREALFSVEDADTWMENAHNLVMAEPGGSVYVPPLETTDVWRIFSGRLSYKKGAAILHMLRNEIDNDPLFFQSLQTFQQVFEDSVATGDDFMGIVEQVTGTSWQYFFDQWYYGEGYPIFQINWWQEDDQFFVRVLQDASTENPSFFYTSLEFVIHTPDQDIEQRVFQDQPEQVFTFTVNEVVDSLSFDPHNWLLKQSTLVPVGLDPGFSIGIFPNPFKEGFTILNPDFSGQETYTIYDIRGRVISKGNISGYQTEVLLPETATGIMILEISSKNSAPWVTKIVRNP